MKARGNLIHLSFRSTKCEYLDGSCLASPRWVSLLVAEIYYPDATFPNPSPNQNRNPVQGGSPPGPGVSRTFFTLKVLVQKKNSFKNSVIYIYVEFGVVVIKLRSTRGSNCSSRAELARLESCNYCLKC